ncbi:hypothetical protein ABEG91_22400 [Pantoea agglomerans]|uniref:hypothetical protein n=1 Tax=Enterobacter agglomerans TaxID=549 RepID=UPI003208FD91
MQKNERNIPMLITSPKWPTGWMTMLSAVFIVGSGYPFATLADDDTTATVTIKATVMADCTVSVNPSTLDLGSISASTLQGKAINTALEGMSKTVTVTSTCAGASKARMTIKSGSKVADGKVVPEGDVLRFGLKIADTVEPFSDDTQSVTREIESADLSTGHNEDLQFFAAMGGATPKAGTYTSNMTIMIEPE